MRKDQFKPTPEEIEFLQQLRNFRNTHSWNRSTQLELYLDGLYEVLKYGNE